MNIVFVLANKNDVGTMNKREEIPNGKGGYTVKNSRVKAIKPYSREFPETEASNQPGKIGMAYATALRLVEQGYKNVRILNPITNKEEKVTQTHVKKHRQSLNKIADRQRLETHRETLRLRKEQAERMKRVINPPQETRRRAA